MNHDAGHRGSFFSSLLDETYYWYDRRGLLIKASNLAALVELERDGNGRIIRETTNGRSIESKLDARGNRIERRIGRGEPARGSSSSAAIPSAWSRLSRSTTTRRSS